MKNKFGLIISDTLRSKIYFTVLLKNGVIPNYVIYLKDKRKKYQFSNKNNSNSFLKDKKIRQELRKLKINLILNFESEIHKQRIDHNIYKTTNIHDKRIINKIKVREENIFIYSGYPGIILSDDILQMQKMFLHIHGGYLPKYKGSTTNYYSILDDNTMGASAIIMSNKIDGGPIILRKKFTVPNSKILIDHVYDSYFRAEVLHQVITKIKLNNVKLRNTKKNIGGKQYFIIHPLLKHISILKQ